MSLRERFGVVAAVCAGLGALALAGTLGLLSGCWNSKSYPPLERHRVDASNHTSYFPIGANDVHRFDCAACHGGTASFLEFACVTCHDHPQAHTDSLHIGIDGYAYDSAACYLCHPNGTAAGVDHTLFFPIEAGAKHGGIHCGQCHPDSRDHKVFTCVSCHDHAQAHTDSTHAGVTGYAFESASCLRCHPNAEVIGRDAHSAFFPILAGAHATTACADCHRTPHDYRTFSCTDCHAHTQAHSDSTHAGLPGYRFDSPACVACHPQGDVMTRARHASFFPIESGLHSPIGCLECHDTPGDFREFTCLSCHNHAQAHTDSTHVGVSGYLYASAACLRCHPNAEVMTRDQHTPYFPIATGAHASTTCGGCHETPGNYRLYTCVSCHEHSAGLMDPAHAGLPGYAFDSASCLTCHPQGSVMTRAQHDPLFPIASGAHALACGACHTTPRDYRAFECILCHEHDCATMNPKHAEVGGYTCVSSECYRCHPRGQGEGGGGDGARTR